jgi:hypothetical protein
MPPRRARKVTGSFQAGLVNGNMVEFPPVGAELENVRVRFTWEGKDYEAGVFEEFLDATAEIFAPPPRTEN